MRLGLTLCSGFVLLFIGCAQVNKTSSLRNPSSEIDRVELLKEKLTELEIIQSSFKGLGFTNDGYQCQLRVGERSVDIQIFTPECLEDNADMSDCASDFYFNSNYDTEIHSLTMEEDYLNAVTSSPKSTFPGKSSIEVTNNPQSIEVKISRKRNLLGLIRSPLACRYDKNKIHEFDRSLLKKN
jgi:hypothetical protein